MSQQIHSSEPPETCSIQEESLLSEKDACTGMPLSLTIRNILSQKPMANTSKTEATEASPRNTESVESFAGDMKGIESKFIKCYPHSDIVVHAYRQGRHYISCKSCIAYPELVKRYSYKRRLPPIATPKGTIFRRETLHNHIKTSGHIETSKVYRSAMANLTEGHHFPAVPTSSPLPPTPSQPVFEDSLELVNQVGGMMVLLYDAAKRLMAFDADWPSRTGVVQRAIRYHLGQCGPRELAESLTEKGFSSRLMGINCQELLECIVEAHRAHVIKKLDQAVAVSLHCDSHIDPTQTDKLFLTCKIVLPNGHQERIFLGLSEPEERGASSVFQAIKDGIVYNFGADSQLVLDSFSSVTYDGTNVTSGERGELWDAMDQELTTCKDKHLIKVWCALHRPELAWQSVSSATPELATIFQRLINLSSYFHTSGVRLRELRRMAKQLKLELFQLPEVSEVHWTDFSYGLLNAVLISWQPLVSYLKEASKRDKVAQDHYHFMTSLGQLELLTFLADLAFVFHRFQKGIQRNSIGLLDLEDAVRMVCATIHTLKTQQLPGGWQNAMQEMLQEDDDGGIFLKGIALGRHWPDDGRRDTGAVQREVADSLFQFLQQGFHLDEALSSLLQPFVQLNVPETDVPAVHGALVPELELAELAVQFQELGRQESTKKLNLAQLVRHLASSPHYSEVCAALSQVLVVKPHASDIEWIANASQTLRSSNAKSLSRVMENYYLFVHLNLPSVEEWDPKAALITWLQRQRTAETSSTVRRTKGFQGP